jgi:hypothetical protein
VRDAMPPVFAPMDSATGVNEASGISKINH